MGAMQMLASRSAHLLAVLAAAAALLALLALGAPSARADHYNRLLAPAKACPHQKNPADSIRTQKKAMRCMHNYARRRVGARKLRKQRKLQRSSKAKAADILRCGDFDHNACGRDAFYWLRRVEFAVGCYAAGENLTMGSGQLGSVRSRMSAWLHSDLHRQALLRRSYRKAGISMLRGTMQGHQVQVWVAHFGSRC